MCSSVEHNNTNKTFCKYFLSTVDYLYLLGVNVIKCHLSRFMGERKLKVVDLARETGINRGTLTRLYFETAERLEVDVIDRLCKYFSCDLGDLFQYVEDKQEK